MLTRRELLDVLQFGQTVLECRSPDELRNQALDLLLRMFDCQSGSVFYKAEDEFLDMENVLIRGLCSKKMAEYRQYYFRLDPFFGHFPLPRPVMTMDQVIAPGMLLRSEFYNELLKPQSIRYQLNLSPPMGKAWCGVALHRPANKKTFGKNDLAKARLVVPYLAGALQKIDAANVSQHLERLVKTMAVHLPFEGLIALDETHTNFFLDAGAQRILASLATRDQRQRASSAVLPQVLIDACAQLLEDTNRGRKPSLTMKLQRADGASQQSVSAEIRVIHQPFESPMFIVGLNHGGNATEEVRQLKKKGISKRELEVIFQVLDGRTNAEIAAILFISEYTVQNHLQAIYRKLAIKNRTSLIRKLMVLPMFAAAVP